MQLDQTYWENRYQNQETGWDIGYVSTPLKAYFDQLSDQELKILVPGAGNAYEAGYLWELGFVNTHVLDVAQAPLDSFQGRFPTFPKSQLIREDFFQHQGTYDLIIEQTFFCALEPSLRSNYVSKTKQLLNPGGKLVGLLWNKPMRLDGSPPYGGSEEEYQQLFAADFNLEIMELAHNSIKPRLGNEVFIKFVRKD